MAACRDCAQEHEPWPEDGCPNCGSPEPAPVEPAVPGAATPTRTRAGRRGSGQSRTSGGDG